MGVSRKSVIQYIQRISKREEMSGKMTMNDDMGLPLSVNGVPIRLTEERRQHIESEHPDIHACLSEIFRTVSDPDFIQEGNFGALMAVRLSANFDGKYVIVVYRETEQTDGFIITAYLARTLSNRRRVLWESLPSPQSENP